MNKRHVTGLFLAPLSAFLLLSAPVVSQDYFPTRDYVESRRAAEAKAAADEANRQAFEANRLRQQQIELEKRRVYFDSERNRLLYMQMYSSEVARRRAELDKKEEEYNAGMEKVRRGTAERAAYYERQATAPPPVEPTSYLELELDKTKRELASTKRILEGMSSAGADRDYDLRRMQDRLNEASHQNARLMQVMEFISTSKMSGEEIKKVLAHIVGVERLNSTEMRNILAALKAEEGW